MVMVEAISVLHHIKREWDCPVKCPGYVQGRKCSESDPVIVVISGALSFFCRAMLCKRGICHHVVSVRPSVSLSRS